MIKKFFILLSMFLLFFSFLIPVAAQENIQFFGSEPLAHEKDKGRNLATCLAGWRQFLSSTVGGAHYQSILDYFLDFFRWPSHYADIANVQEQLNRARYAVMAAFLRCDFDRLKSVTEAYYRLEAELYFVRHFVDTEGGFLNILTENPSSREKFKNDLVSYLWLIKPAENTLKERALYEGYFALFEAKYRQRAKTYANPQGDAIFDELAAKFEKLIETFKGFQEFGEEFTKLADETVLAAAVGVYDAASEVYKNTGSALGKAGEFIAKKFLDACVETPDSRYCVFGEDVKKEGGFFAGTEFEKFIGNFTKGGKKSFSDIMIAISEGQARRTEDLDKAEMLTRYEMLYGQVSGSGVSALLGKIDKLQSMLGEGEKKLGIPGSLQPLTALQECADEVHDRQCS